MDEYTVLTTAQQIRLQSAQLLAGLAANHPCPPDWSAASLAQDVLLLAKAIETGSTAE